MFKVLQNILFEATTKSRVDQTDNIIKTREATKLPSELAINVSGANNDIDKLNSPIRFAFANLLQAVRQFSDKTKQVSFNADDALIHYTAKQKNVVKETDNTLSTYINMVQHLNSFTPQELSKIISACNNVVSKDNPVMKMLHLRTTYKQQAVIKHFENTEHYNDDARDFSGMRAYRGYARFSAPIKSRLDVASLLSLIESLSNMFTEDTLEAKIVEILNPISIKTTTTISSDDTKNLQIYKDSVKVSILKLINESYSRKEEYDFNKIINSYTKSGILDNTLYPGIDTLVTSLTKLGKLVDPKDTTSTVHSIVDTLRKLSNEQSANEISLNPEIMNKANDLVLNLNARFFPFAVFVNPINDYKDPTTGEFTDAYTPAVKEYTTRYDYNNKVNLFLSDAKKANRSSVAFDSFIDTFSANNQKRNAIACNVIRSAFSVNEFKKCIVADGNDQLIGDNILDTIPAKIAKLYTSNSSVKSYLDELSNPAVRDVAELLASVFSFKKANESSFKTVKSEFRNAADTILRHPESYNIKQVTKLSMEDTKVSVDESTPEQRRLSTITRIVNDRNNAEEFDLASSVVNANSRDAIKTNLIKSVPFVGLSNPILSKILSNHKLYKLCTKILNRIDSAGTFMEHAKNIAVSAKLAGNVDITNGVEQADNIFERCMTDANKISGTDKLIDNYAKLMDTYYTNPDVAKNRSNYAGNIEAIVELFESTNIDIHSINASKKIDKQSINDEFKKSLENNAAVLEDLLNDNKVCNSLDLLSKRNIPSDIDVDTFKDINTHLQTNTLYNDEVKEDVKAKNVSAYNYNYLNDTKIDMSIDELIEEISKNSAKLIINTFNSLNLKAGFNLLSVLAEHSRAKKNISENKESLKKLILESKNGFSDRYNDLRKLYTNISFLATNQLYNDVYFETVWKAIKELYNTKNIQDNSTKTLINSTLLDKIDNSADISSTNNEIKEYYNILQEYSRYSDFINTPYNKNNDYRLLTTDLEKVKLGINEFKDKLDSEDISAINKFLEVANTSVLSNDALLSKALETVPRISNSEEAQEFIKNYGTVFKNNGLLVSSIWKDDIDLTFAIFNRMRQLPDLLEHNLGYNVMNMFVANGDEIKSKNIKMLFESNAKNICLSAYYNGTTSEEIESIIKDSSKNIDSTIKYVKESISDVLGFTIEDMQSAREDNNLIFMSKIDTITTTSEEYVTELADNAFKDTKDAVKSINKIYSDLTKNEDTGRIKKTSSIIHTILNENDKLIFKKLLTYIIDSVNAKILIPLDLVASLASLEEAKQKEVIRIYIEESLLSGLGSYQQLTNKVKEWCKATLTNESYDATIMTNYLLDTVSTNLFGKFSTLTPSRNWIVEKGVRRDTIEGGINISQVKDFISSRLDFIFQMFYANKVLITNTKIHNTINIPTKYLDYNNETRNTKEHITNNIKVSANDIDMTRQDHDFASEIRRAYYLVNNAINNVNIYVIEEIQSNTKLLYTPLATSTATYNNMIDAIFGDIKRKLTSKDASAIEKLFVSTTNYHNMIKYIDTSEDKTIKKISSILKTVLSDLYNNSVGYHQNSYMSKILASCGLVLEVYRDRAIEILADSDNEVPKFISTFKINDFSNHYDQIMNYIIAYYNKYVELKNAIDNTAIKDINGQPDKATKAALDAISFNNFNDFMNAKTTSNPISVLRNVDIRLDPKNVSAYSKLNTLIANTLAKNVLDTKDNISVISSPKARMIISNVLSENLIDTSLTSENINEMTDSIVELLSDAKLIADPTSMYSEYVKVLKNKNNNILFRKYIPDITVMKNKNPNNKFKNITANVGDTEPVIDVIVEEIATNLSNMFNNTNTILSNKIAEVFADLNLYSTGTLNTNDKIITMLLFKCGRTIKDTTNKDYVFSLSGLLNNTTMFKAYENIIAGNGAANKDIEFPFITRKPSMAPMNFESFDKLCDLIRPYTRFIDIHDPKWQSEIVNSIHNIVTRHINDAKPVLSADDINKTKSRLASENLNYDIITKEFEFINDNTSRRSSVLGEGTINFQNSVSNIEQYCEVSREVAEKFCHIYLAKEAEQSTRIKAALIDMIREKDSSYAYTKRFGERLDYNTERDIPSTAIVMTLTSLVDILQREKESSIEDSGLLSEVNIVNTAKAKMKSCLDSAYSTLSKSEIGALSRTNPYAKFIDKTNGELNNSAELAIIKDSVRLNTLRNLKIIGGGTLKTDVEAAVIGFLSRNPGTDIDSAKVYKPIIISLLRTKTDSEDKNIKAYLINMIKFILPLGSITSNEVIKNFNAATINSDIPLTNAISGCKLSNADIIKELDGFPEYDNFNSYSKGLISALKTESKPTISATDESTKPFTLLRSLR